MTNRANPNIRKLVMDEPDDAIAEIEASRQRIEELEHRIERMGEDIEKLMAIVDSGQPHIILSAEQVVGMYRAIRDDLSCNLIVETNGEHVYRDGECIHCGEPEHGKPS
jgi:hypothetical protein